MVDPAKILSEVGCNIGLEPNFLYLPQHNIYLYIYIYFDVCLFVTAINLEKVYLKEFRFC